MHRSARAMAIKGERLRVKRAEERRAAERAARASKQTKSGRRSHSDPLNMFATSVATNGLPVRSVSAPPTVDVT
jgi:hypothetical protein